jgi:hypothetical protein
MRRYQGTFIVLFITLLSVFLVSIPVGSSCKDIVAVGDATEGDYNLLLKVRDPSRPGLQVLCRVPAGYEYTYSRPWTGKPLDFAVRHTFIGVATIDDTPPDIVKAGMAFSDAGLAYGDADTNSLWINPSRHAWDDFDWIRYACQTADNENQAVDLLTSVAVKEMHAPGVSENLFVVGPRSAVVIEADAVHYTITDIDGVLVMSNYPKDLWRTQRLQKLPLASSFDAEKETWVRQGRTIRLGSLCGVKITDIGEDFIVAKPVPFFAFFSLAHPERRAPQPVHIGEHALVGDYSVTLLDINDNQAKVSVSYVFKAWEEKMYEYIQSAYGHITVKDLMNWSRLHSNDLNGLRAMCEDISTYEAAMIYKIPQEHSDVLSCGWFSANHACSSIYVPVHICDTDFYDPYETGDAADLSLKLLEQYGHGNLTSAFQTVETVFLHETEKNEHYAQQLIRNNSDVTAFLTILDIGMQQQAYLTEQLWSESKNNQPLVKKILESIWETNYTLSLEKMKQTTTSLQNITKSTDVIEKIGDIAGSICRSKIDAAHMIGKNMTQAEEHYQLGETALSTGRYTEGFDHLQQAFLSAEMLLTNQTISETLNHGSEDHDSGVSVVYILLCVILVVLVFVVLIRYRHGNKE